MAWVTLGTAPLLYRLCSYGNPPPPETQDLIKSNVRKPAVQQLRIPSPVKPESTPEDWNISGTKWLKVSQLHRYIAFLSTQYPEITTPVSLPNYNIDNLISEMKSFKEDYGDSSG